VSKIFVAGATGVLGRRAVQQLVEAGHDVTGVARTEEKADLLRSLGATPVTVDLFDRAAVQGAVDGHDVVMNLATHIPAMSKAALPGVWKENDRIRAEASRNLVDAALATGASRYVQEAVSFMYADSGAEWIDEGAALDMPSIGNSMEAAEEQTHRFTEGGGTGVVLRFGQFYAPDAVHTQTMAKLARRRLTPALGPDDSYVTTIHADDAGAAVVAALRAPAGVYNVTDDEPVTRRQFGETVAAAFGRRPPHKIPEVLGKAGGEKGRFYMRSQRVSNKRFKDATGWSPRYPSVREGWPVVAAAMKEG
jgi:nucleoside-diphosphate-sugar epimerase